MMQNSKALYLKIHRFTEKHTDGQIPSGVRSDFSAQNFTPLSITNQSIK